MMIARLNLPLPTGETFRSVIRPDLVCRAQHTDQAPSLTFFKSLKALCTTLLRKAYITEWQELFFIDVVTDTTRYGVEKNLLSMLEF